MKFLKGGEFPKGGGGRTIEDFVRRFIQPGNNLEKFLKYQNHAYGTSHNRNKGNSGRPKSARTQTNIDAVQRKLNDNPGASARRSNIPQITKLSFNRITKHDLNF